MKIKNPPLEKEKNNIFFIISPRNKTLSTLEEDILCFKIKQAGAELCQAQSSLQLNLASYKLSSLQLKSSNQH